MVVATLLLTACGSLDTHSAPPNQAATSPSAAASPSVIPLPTPTVAGTIAFSRLLEEQGEGEVCIVNTDGTGLETLAGGRDWATVSLLVAGWEADRLLRFGQLA